MDRRSTTAASRLRQPTGSPAHTAAGTGGNLQYGYGRLSALSKGLSLCAGKERAVMLHQCQALFVVGVECAQGTARNSSYQSSALQRRCGKTVAGRCCTCRLSTNTASPWSTAGSQGKHKVSVCAFPATPHAVATTSNMPEPHRFFRTPSRTHARRYNNLQRRRPQATRSR